MISDARREDIVGALRRGTVPSSGLDALAVGIGTFALTLDEELAAVAAGRGGFKAVRGEYGTGKTFFGRWLQERARARGFAASEVQINETETSLHKLETVYRRLVERLGTADTGVGAFRGVIDGWFYALEQDVLADKAVDARNAEDLLARTNALMEARLATINKTAPAFSAVPRIYRRAVADGDTMLADGLISWLAGQPNVAASVKRAAGIKGDLDHFGATNFIVGLLTILRDSGFAGLVLVLDEVETLQRMRTDTREKGLNAASVLYICPIKALLNNLEQRLSYYAGLVGRRVKAWHGDVSQSRKQRALKDAPDILLTTPESIEAMLISTRVDQQAWFGNLQAVIVATRKSCSTGSQLLANARSSAMPASAPTPT